jgi:hypothetical protein
MTATLDAHLPRSPEGDPPMTTVDATLAPPPEPAADPVPGQPAAVWLPLTAGDVGKAVDQSGKEPEHEWPASVFMFITNLTAIGLALGAVGCVIGVVVALAGGELGAAGLAGGLAVALALGSVIQLTLAKHVKNFSRWGWFGAMVELGIATLTKVASYVSEPANIGMLMMIGLDVLWMRYFWNRREDFGVDIDF